MNRQCLATLSLLASNLLIATEAAYLRQGIDAKVRLRASLMEDEDQPLYVAPPADPFDDLMKLVQEQFAEMEEEIEEIKQEDVDVIEFDMSHLTIEVDPEPKKEGEQEELGQLDALLSAEEEDLEDIKEEIDLIDWEGVEDKGEVEEEGEEALTVEIDPAPAAVEIDPRDSPDYIQEEEEVVLGEFSEAGTDETTVEVDPEEVPQDFQEKEEDEDKKTESKSDSWRSEKQLKKTEAIHGGRAEGERNEDTGTEETAKDEKVSLSSTDDLMKRVYNREGDREHKEGRGGAGGQGRGNL